MHRRKGELDYWVVVGGGVESGESFEATATRELIEEVGLAVNDLSELCTVNLAESVEKYFIEYVDDCSDVKILGEELLRSNNENIYVPTWVDIDTLEKLNLYPQELKDTLLAMLPKLSS